ncbi:MAG: alanyl-tRNA editing protein AlaXM [Candidatus Woesearchaeota archaeon]
MTEMLYLLDCYIKDFNTIVSDIREQENNFLIVLEQTAFYPRAGGQPEDRGFLIKGNYKYLVKDVLKSNDKVIHVVEKTNDFDLKRGDAVRGIIDWERRYYFMRCHTAAHILSAIINKETGALITGNNIDEEKVRIDFNLENFDREKFNEYVKMANDFINENHPVELSILDREEAFKIPDLVKLQKMLPESIKKVRIVKIQGLDVQACGGAHVKNTSEIKGIQLLSVENKGKNNRRIYFRIL